MQLIVEVRRRQFGDAVEFQQHRLADRDIVGCRFAKAGTEIDDHAAIEGDALVGRVQHVVVVGVQRGKPDTDVVIQRRAIAKDRVALKQQQADLVLSLDKVGDGGLVAAAIPVRVEGGRLVDRADFVVAAAQGQGRAQLGGAERGQDVVVVAGEDLVAPAIQEGIVAGALEHGVGPVRPRW